MMFHEYSETLQSSDSSSQPRCMEPELAAIVNNKMTPLNGARTRAVQAASYPDQTDILEIESCIYWDEILHTFAASQTTSKAV